jgi:hypothetical protein
MARQLTSLDEPDLERHLLRRSVHELSAGRRACADCGRTPLTGERTYRYARGEVVCELCRPAHEGEPQRSDVVHHCEHGHTVRVRPRLAA